MSYTITYYNDAVQAEIMALPTTLQARYIGLTARMMEYGANCRQAGWNDGGYE
jgi:hypothetical protein